MSESRSFGSDNHAGVHPKILEAIARANEGTVHAYGSDPFTEQASHRFKSLFGEGIEVYFVFTGTAANVLAIQSVARPHHGVLAADNAHINCDEAGAPEAVTGCKILRIPDTDGKLTADSLVFAKRYLADIGNPHRSQPKLISISQSTELGTVYQPDEIKAIADFAHQNGLYLHMDGARIANAAASLGVELREITANVGVDILSFGGTKNGMMAGEAVVFFDPSLSREFNYQRKQAMQLASKMRFFSAQFNALLTDDLWRKNAVHANQMARLLAREVERVPHVQITRKVEANAVFAKIPRESIPTLQKRFSFYVWDDATAEVRWMTAFDTTEAEVLAFAQAIKEVMDH